MFYNVGLQTGHPREFLGALGTLRPSPILTMGGFMECKILFNVEGSWTVNTLMGLVFFMMDCVSQKLVPFGELFFTDITFELTIMENEQ